MTDICQRQFRFLKFSFGPVCPNPRCPGASSDGKVLPLDPSSDESDEDNDGNSTCDEAVPGFPGEGRQHVICLDPAVPTRPLWCNSTPVHEFEEIKQWLVKVRDRTSRLTLYLLSSSKESQMNFGSYCLRQNWVRLGILELFLTSPTTRENRFPCRRSQCGSFQIGSLSKSLRLAPIRLPEVNFPKNVTLRICVGCIQP